MGLKRGKVVLCLGIANYAWFRRVMSSIGSTARKKLIELQQHDEFARTIS
jgi:hypothetical protein